MSRRLLYNDTEGMRMVQLFIYPKTGEPSTFALGAKRVSIGRAATNDIVLSDQFSSGCHAVIAPTERGYALLDQGSKNGTFVNGRRVNGELDLTRGDEILVGSTRFYFDRDLQTNIEMVEGTTFTHSSNTIIQVKDILKKPPSSGALKTPGGGLDLDRLQQDQKIIAVIGEVSQALIYHMPLDKLLEHIMDVLTQHLPMDRGVLMLKDEATQVARAQGHQDHERGPEDAEHLRQPDDHQDGPRAELGHPHLGHPVRRTAAGPGQRRPGPDPLGHVRAALEQPGHHRTHLLRPGLPPRAVRGGRPAAPDASRQPGRGQDRERPPLRRIPENDPNGAGAGPGRADPEELPAAGGALLRALRHQRRHPGLLPRRRGLLRFHPHRQGPAGRRHRRRRRRGRQRRPAHGLAAGGPPREVPHDLQPERAHRRPQRFRLHELGQPLFHLLLLGGRRSAQG